MPTGGGTPHKKPPLSATGHPIHESTSLAEYLISQGVEPLSIFKEVSSHDTVGNAYFAMTIHALPAGWKKMAVVTSDFHMPRTREIFSDIFDLASRHRANGNMGGCVVGLCTATSLLHYLAERHVLKFNHTVVFEVFKIC